MNNLQAINHCYVTGLYAYGYEYTRKRNPLIGVYHIYMCHALKELWHKGVVGLAEASDHIAAMSEFTNRLSRHYTMLNNGYELHFNSMHTVVSEAMEAFNWPKELQDQRESAVMAQFYFFLIFDMTRKGQTSLDQIDLERYV